MKRLSGLVSRIARRVGVQTDVVAIHRDETIAVITKLVVPRLEAKRGGHLGLVLVGYTKVVIAEDVVMVGLKFVVDRCHVPETLEVSVDEVAEVHDEPQFEPVQVFNTRRQFFRRQRVLTLRRFWHLDVAVLAVGNHAERKNRLTAWLGKKQHLSAKPGGKEMYQANGHESFQPLRYLRRT